MKKSVEGWTWFSDYVYSYSEWNITCPADRTVQVGMGVFIGGEPRGEKIAVSGSGVVKAIGIGAIYVRSYDRKGPCNVDVALKKGIPITIINCPSSMREFKALSTGKPSILNKRPHPSHGKLTSEDVATIERFNQALKDITKLAEKFRSKHADDSG